MGFSEATLSWRLPAPGAVRRGRLDGTCTLLFALWCRFVRRERLSVAGWLAVALDLAGIALPSG